MKPDSANAKRMFYNAIRQGCSITVNHFVGPGYPDTIWKKRVAYKQYESMVTRELVAQASDTKAAETILNVSCFTTAPIRAKCLHQNSPPRMRPIWLLFDLLSGMVPKKIQRIVID